MDGIKTQLKPSLGSEPILMQADEKTGYVPDTETVKKRKQEVDNTEIVAHFYQGAGILKMKDVFLVAKESYDYYPRDFSQMY